MDAAESAARAHGAAQQDVSRRISLIQVSLDTTAAVTAGMQEILYTLLEALALVVLVVYIFLQGWRATLIPLLAVPVSLIGTFVVFPMLGFSINTLSLFGLVLAIGLVVDDAIVVVEAVERHIEEGMTPQDAALQGHGRSLRPGRRHRADPDAPSSSRLSSSPASPAGCISSLPSPSRSLSFSRPSMRCRSARRSPLCC